MVKLSMLNRLNIASASARWLVLDLTCSQFHGKGSGELRDHPVADPQAAGLLVAEPGLHAPGFRLIRQRCNEQRRIQIKCQ
jgi:hypothetical protein